LLLLTFGAKIAKKKMHNWR